MKIKKSIKNKQKTKLLTKKNVLPGIVEKSLFLKTGTSVSDLNRLENIQGVPIYKLENVQGVPINRLENVQGVPINMTVQSYNRDIQSSTYTLICMILQKIIRKVLLVLAFPKCGLPFLCFQYYQNFVQISILLNKPKLLESRKFVVRF